MNAVATMNHSLQDMQTMAASIARSGLFGMKSEDQALALMLVAQAEGMHPATITQDYDIIQGKACRKSHSVMARFQTTGGKVEWHALTEQLADATFSHPAGGSLRMSWTMKQAIDAKLAGKDNWKNYPRAMLRARLIAEAIRAIYPAALGGMLLAEEAQDLDAATLERGEPRNMGMADVVQADKPANALPACSDEQFAVDLPIYRKAIAKGKKTVDDVLNTVSTAFALSQAQIDSIKAIPSELVKAAGQRAPDERTGPAVNGGPTEGEILQMIEKAANTDDLALAADLINSIKDNGAQKRLNAAFDARADAVR